MVTKKKPSPAKKPVSKGKANNHPVRASKKREARVSAAGDPAPRTKIRIIGIGGGGGNILSEIAGRVARVDFVAANTDTQALKEVSRKLRQLNFGYEVTGGLGAGMDPEVGRKAAEADKERIKKLCEGQDICILLASLGGGTASGAVPVFAEACKELGVLSVGMFTMPFSFEGARRTEVAQDALRCAIPLLNSYGIYPNERIFQIVDKNTPLKHALSGVNKRLAGSLEGFIEMLALPGLINVDFADVRSMLEGRGGLAYINTVTVSGENRAAEALRSVGANPLSEYDMTGMERILFHVAGDKRLRMREVGEISRAIAAFSPKARIIFGISVEPRLKNGIRVTVFGVGKQHEEKETEKRKSSKPKKKPEKKIADSEPVSTVSQEPERQETETVQKKERKQIKKGEKSTGGMKKAKKTKIAPSVSKKPLPPKSEAPSPSNPVLPPAEESSPKVRRNALDVHQAIHREIQDLEENEDKWDIPAFLRNERRGV